MEFLDIVKSEKRRWMMDQLPDDYCHSDLTAFGLTAFNNINGDKDRDGWKITISITEADVKRATEKEREVKILALSTEAAKKAFGNEKNSGQN